MFKKSLAMVAVLTLFATIAPAQSVNESVTQVREGATFLDEIQVTPRIGLSSFKLNADSQELAFDNENGFAIGVTAEKRVRSYLGIEAGVMYVQMGGSTKAGGDFAFTPANEGEMNDEFEEGFGENAEEGFDEGLDLGRASVLRRAPAAVRRRAMLPISSTPLISWARSEWAPWSAPTV